MVVVRDIEPWDALLEAGRDDERLVMQASQHPRPPQEVAIPEELHPEVAEALGKRGIDRLWSHQAEALHAAWAGPDDRHHRHRLRQVAVLQPPHARRPLPRRAGARAVPVSDEGAGAGPGAGAERARRRAGAAGDLRRGHPARAAVGDPAALQHRHHQPRHAPPRDPAQPPGVGRLLRQPGGGRGRRGARLPRRVRLARRQRAAAAAADRGRLRDRAAVPARLRHRRQPRRAGGAADRPRRHHGRRPRRRTRGEADDRDVEPADRGRADRGAAVGAGRDRRPARRARDRGRAHDRVHEVAQGGRADVALRAAAPRGPGPRRARRADRALPRRLHAAAAARARAAAARGRAARRGGHQRARARHRHRRARRGDLRHLPRHRRLAAADVGAGGPARARPGALHRGRGRARPVLLPPPGRVPRPPGRGGDPRPVQRAAARRAPALRRARGPARGRRRRDPRRPLARVRGGAGVGRRPARAAGRDVRAAPARGVPGRRGLAAVREPRRRRDRRHDLGRAARHRRRQARAHHRPRRRGVPARRAVVRGRRARPRGPARDGAPVHWATTTRSPSTRPTRTSSG